MSDTSREAVEALIVRLTKRSRRMISAYQDDDTAMDREAASALSSLLSERDEALGYASRFLASYVQEYCDPVPEWKPLDELIGVLTQIDNASTVTDKFKARAEAAEAEIASLRARYEAHTDYSIDLQRIIEDLCQGRPIREPKTTARHHYDMAVTADASLRARLEQCEQERDGACEVMNAAVADYNDELVARRSAEAARAKAEEALEPFALVAELDIGMDEADDDLFRPISEPRNALAPRIKVGDLRRAHAAYASRTTGGNNGG